MSAAGPTGGNGGDVRTLRVGALARVEGEGALHVAVRDGRVEDVRFEIVEPPRYFEGLLRGRRFDAAPDVTARICGICPVAYQMAAVRALEQALGVEIPEPIRTLRRIFMCGEWVSSHALHVFMLHAPDFLGFEDAIALSREHPGVVERGFALKQAGGDVMTTIGGRDVHPINARVGGFHRIPPRRELRALADRLRPRLDDARAALAWAATLPIPAEGDALVDHELVALRTDDRAARYPMNEGRIVSTEGLDVDAAAYEDCFRETQVPHSTALHATIVGRGAYLVGPLARFALNADRLTPVARDAAAAVDLEAPCRNPFASILVRLVEIVDALDEAIALLDADAPPDAPAVEVTPRAGVGAAAVEAPRGVLWHRYETDGDGRIVTARIVPPTSQNQLAIEGDLRRVVERAFARGPDPDETALVHRCEQSIRNHDPCISCATHFLRLSIDRRTGRAVEAGPDRADAGGDGTS